MTDRNQPREDKFMRVCVASSRGPEIGRRCITWASENLPEGWQMSGKDTCDVFISVLYGELLPESFIAPRRCYNFHPGLLPDYRGSGSFSWALINKERRTGVTLHEIDKDIDHGAIIDIQPVPIEPTDTAETLFLTSMEMLFCMFTENFLSLLTGDYLTRPNEGGHLYLRQDLEEAKDITNIVKAFEFPGKEPCYWVDSQGTKHYVEYQ